MLIDGYLYFRSIDNPADSLTIYKRILDNAIDIGEMPSLGDPLVETVFSLKDLIHFYDKYAVYDERIRLFCEKVTDMVKTGDHT